MLEDILKRLDFSDKEIAVYLAVVRSGRMTHTQVGRETGINRTTIYSVASELIKKGVLAEDLGSTKAYLVALPPEDLNSLTKQKEQELEAQKDLISKAIEQLSEFAKQSKYHIPKILFIPEEQLESHLYARSQAWSNSIIENKTQYWGFQDHTLVERYLEWIDWYWEQAFAKDVHLKLLTNDSTFEREVMSKKRHERRLIRFWGRSEGFTATTQVAGDFVIFINTREHPFYLIELHDAAIAASMRHIFEGIWNELESR